MDTAEIRENRAHVRDMIRQVCPDLHVDPLLAEAIAWKEERSFDPASSRYEPGFFDDYMRDMSNEDLTLRNPQCPARCSYATERNHEATSWGPLHILGATARERGFRGPFLSELCRSLWAGIYWGCRQIQHVETLAKRQGFERRILVSRVILAYNTGPGSLRDDIPSHDKMITYVSPILLEWDRLRNLST